MVTLRESALKLAGACLEHVLSHGLEAPFGAEGPHGEAPQGRRLRGPLCGGPRGPLRRGRGRRRRCPWRRRSWTRRPRSRRPSAWWPVARSWCKARSSRRRARRSARSLRRAGGQGLKGQVQLGGSDRGRPLHARLAFEPSSSRSHPSKPFRRGQAEEIPTRCCRCRATGPRSGPATFAASLLAIRQPLEPCKDLLRAAFCLRAFLRKEHLRREERPAG